MRRNPLLRDIVVWEVIVAEHDSHPPGGRPIHVPRSTVTIGGHSTADSARRRALGWAHSDAGVPPWKPYMRASWRYVTATRHVEQKV